LANDRGRIVSADVAPGRSRIAAALRQRNIKLNASEENDENNIAGYIDFAVAGRTSHLAVQHRLGLLPERRIGSGPADRGDIGSNGPLVMSPSAGGTRDSP